MFGSKGVMELSTVSALHLDISNAETEDTEQPLS
jgi:hypothetical protein